MPDLTLDDWKRLIWLLGDVAERLPHTDVGRERYGELLGWQHTLRESHLTASAPAPAGTLYWPTDPSYPCPTCGHKLPEAAPAGTGEPIQRAYDLLMEAWANGMANLSKVDEIAALQVRDTERYRMAAYALRDAAPPAVEARETVRGTVYGWAEGQMSIVGDPSIPCGEVHVRDEHGRTLMKLVGFDAARSPDTGDTP